IEDAKTNTETAKALVFGKGMAPDPLKELIDSLTRTHNTVDTALRTKLRAWDVVGTLEKKAIEQSGMITPETIIRAYGAVQDSLRTDMVKGGSEYENREKMTLMKTIFVRYVQIIDYVDAN